METAWISVPENEILNVLQRQVGTEQTNFLSSYLSQKHFYIFDVLVNYSVVSGGAALVVGSLVSGTGTLTSVLGLLGKSIFFLKSYP